MPFFDPIRIGAAGAADSDFVVDRSLRFNNGDSAYLRRDPTSTSNRKTSTLSVWLKRTKLSTSNSVVIFSSNKTGSSTAQVQLGFESNNTFTLRARQNGTTNGAGTSTAVFRDPSAWYHIVYVLDTTQATNTNRFKLYVNGEQQTISYNSYPAQNGDLNMNLSGCAMQFGAVYYGGSNVSNRGAFYLAEVNWIDGQAYDPSYFAETNPATGQWNPKKYTGSYGTNGFYLNFSDNSGTTATTLGKDSSGNGNNFTPNNFSVSAGAGNDSLEDTPTNNFCTLNPLAMTATGNVTPSNGNLDASYGSGSGGIAGTFAVSTGKWYWEITITATSSARIDIGVIDDTFETYNGSARYNPGIDSKSYAYTSLGTKYNNNTDTSYGATYTTNDVISIALDLDNGTITFYKNNVSQGQAFSGLTGGFLPGVGDGNSSGTHSISANFGQRAFAYTPPTGYEKLNSSNLPDPTILLPNKQFDTLLYSGNGSQNRAITGLNFKPDWVWLKSRTNTYFHQLHDVVRGTSGGVLYSNNTNAEDSTYGLGSFDSNGFTVYKDGNNDAQNDSGQTYVAWNWNAGDTDGKTYTVTVVDDSGNKYRFDGYGTSAVTLDLAEGGTYIFNYPSGHPFRFSTTSDGTHGGGSEYTTGVTHNSSTQVTIVVAASAPTLYYYCSSHSGMGGQVNTNSTLGSSNFDGSIQTTVKANATAGFSIVSYTGNGTSGATVGHGLGVALDAYIVKRRDGSNSWQVFHQALGNQKFLELHSSGAEQTSSNRWNNTSPTSTVFTLGDNSNVNSNGGTTIAYCFSEVAGYSKFGSYTGNGNANGAFVYTGFRPALVIFKRSSASNSWYMMDNKRNTFNLTNTYLRPDTSAAEGNAVNSTADFLSNGFKFRGSGTDVNANGSTYIYWAFAKSPFKNARAR